MKTISVGQLRQNPTQMLDEVAAGETYLLTRHRQELAQVVPIISSARVMPPRKKGPANTTSLKRVSLPTGISFGSFLEELKGDE